MKEEIEKEVTTRKDKFRCKKCGGWFKLVEARSIIVMQKNKPLEYDHVMFSSKADVQICGDCHKSMRRD